jgi:hypothetical protein
LVDLFEYEVDENGNSRGRNSRGRNVRAVLTQEVFLIPIYLLYKDLAERSIFLFTNPILDMVT